MSLLPFLPGSLIPLLDGAIRSLLMAAIVGLGLALVRVRNVHAQKAAWTLVLAGAIFIPVLTPWVQSSRWISRQIPPLPLLSWAKKAIASAEDVSLAAKAPTHPAPLEATTRPTQIPTVAAEYHFPAPAISFDRLSPTPPAASNRGPMDAPGALQIVFVVYALTAGLLLTRLLFGLLASLRLWITAEPVQLDADLRDRRPLSIRSSPSLASPVTIGAAIVLPSSYRSWDEQKLRIVLAHEASHVGQGDFYLQLLASAYAAVFWFSPLGWWLKRKLCDLSEAVSDAAAVREASSRASYAQVLLQFAALPRPTQIGVAMARKGRLSDRIERLLNEARFRQAFANSHARKVAALLLAPLALFAATALVRVEASGQAPAPPPAPPAPTEPAAAPAPPSTAPDSPEAPVVAPPPPAEAPEPPALDEPQEDRGPAPGKTLTYSRTEIHSDKGGKLQKGSHYSSAGPGYSYSYSANGDSYAVVRGSDKEHITFSGDWMEGRREQLDKARRIAHGDFLWFTRNGKSYVVDDSNTVAQIIAMYKPMEELGRRQEDLGRLQEELGHQQEEMAKRMTQATVNKPDIQKEIEEINRAAQKLQMSREKTVTQDQLAEMQDKLGELQSKLGELQGQMGSHMGELGAIQGELGAKQGKLGEQQGRLGEQQGRLAQDADRKVKSIIDQTMKDGKARPVD